jgi:hypothetical protein
MTSCSKFSFDCKNCHFHNCTFLSDEYNVDHCIPSIRFARGRFLAIYTPKSGRCPNHAIVRYELVESSYSYIGWIGKFFYIYISFTIFILLSMH